MKTTTVIPCISLRLFFSIIFRGAKASAAFRRNHSTTRLTRAFEADRGDGATGPGRGAWVELFSDPAVNPYMVERLTGKRVATIVAGNPWFHPFVWTEPYSFLAEYDAEGHVSPPSPCTRRKAENRWILFGMATSFCPSPSGAANTGGK